MPLGTADTEPALRNYKPSADLCAPPKATPRESARYFKVNGGARLDCSKIFFGLSAVTGIHIPTSACFEWCRTTDQTTDFLWNNVRRSLPKGAKWQPAEGKLLVLGDVTVDAQQEKTLRLGPKFCLETGMKTVEKLAYARVVSDKLSEDEKSRCVSDCVDIVASSGSSKGQRKRFHSLANIYVTNDYAQSSRTKKASLLSCLRNSTLRKPEMQSRRIFGLSK